MDWSLHRRRFLRPAPAGARVAARGRCRTHEDENEMGARRRSGALRAREMEPTVGVEPTNPPLTRRPLWPLSYVGLGDVWVARPGRLERPASGFGTRCSV